MTNTTSTTLLLLLLGGVGAWIMKEQHADAQDALTEAQHQRGALEAGLAEKRSEFQTLTSALLLKKQAAAGQADLAALRAHLTEVENQQRSLRQQQQTMAANARASLIGTVIPNLVLNDGRKPGQAKVIKIDDESVSFTVATGVLRASPLDLPADLRQRFYFTKGAN